MPWLIDVANAVSPAPDGTAAAAGELPPPRTAASESSPARLWEALGMESGDDAQRRRALKAAIARWHPDKWQQSYAGRLARGDDAARILSGVGEIARRINAAKAGLDGS